MAGNIEYSTTGKPHPYHLVRPNIWPLISAFAGGFFAMMMLMYFPGYREALQAGGTNLPFPWGPLLGVVSIMICMFFWWKDVIYESVVEKAHTKIAEIGLRFGMALFIASEVMFFVAFFWAFFSSSLFPSQAIGFVWPPKNIHTIAAFDLPFLMTMILLLSGCTVTWAHHAILEGDNKNAVKALGVTVFLGLAFLCFQIYEYAHAHFGFTEGIFPSTFFMATGFHGFHVFVGTVFLAVCWARAQKGHFTPDRHFGFEAAAWYWHFVDVVWLFLFVAIYWWGSEIGMDHSNLHPALESSAAVAAH
ncbi:MAG: cytochrome c oxidase subunit 3 [Rhodospirillales bacterium]|nr:cytochrome c oxidase subunit 3 [Rhodospirillales bacterium]